MEEEVYIFKDVTKIKMRQEYLDWTEETRLYKMEQRCETFKQYRISGNKKKEKFLF